MNREIKGIAIITSVYLVGQIISRLIGNFIPGNVLGMITLFGLLQAGIIKEEDIKGICNFIIKNILILFVPINAGIMVSYKLISDDLISIIFTVISTTILVLVSVGYIQQYLTKRWKK